jgi:hypothetical protein
MENDLELRVSDAERDRAAAALGRHFQAGRLDQAELDERMSAALGARTRGDLASLMADLPRDADDAGPAAEPARGPRGSGRGFPVLPLLPLGIAALFIFGGLAAAGVRHGHAGWTPWPLLWLWFVIPVAIARLRRARRQWR